MRAGRPLLNASDLISCPSHGAVPVSPTQTSGFHMPCNTSAGFVLGMLAFVFGFALIWYIWWLAALSALGMLATVIARSFNDDLEYVIPAAEVARTEAELRARRAGAGAEVPAGAATAPQPVPEG